MLRRMTSVLFLAVCATASVANMAQAQTATKSSTDNAWLQYQAEKENALLPVVVQLAVPFTPAGCAVAGNAKKCLLPAGVTFVGYVVLIGAASSAAEGNTSSGGSAAIGALGILGGTAWGIVNTVGVVNNKNAELRKQLKIASLDLKPVQIRVATANGSQMAFGIAGHLNL